MPNINLDTNVIISFLHCVGVDMLLECQKLQEGYGVYWYNFKVDDIIYEINLCEIIFAELNCAKFGIMLPHFKDEVEIIYITKQLYKLDKNQMYLNFLKNSFNIVGLIFSTKKDCKKFIDYIEKKYTWDTLK